jgi:hypothetical protein
MTPDQVLQHALAIAEEYRRGGLSLTVRQMYYQFVARGLLPSGQRVYKRIVKILSDARYDGRFGLDLIEDRTRTMHPGDFTRNDCDHTAAMPQAERWIRQMPRLLLARDRWYGQPVHVSVWVEKEALAGIFEPTCTDLGVSWMACKGNPSVSSLWAWVKSAAQARELMHTRHGCLHEEERAVILYFGDHDPTGFVIPRAAEASVARLSRAGGLPLDVEVKRVALNMDQIQQYDPPPFWAKTTDSRYQGYVDEHGTEEAWELDALDPSVLRDLIEAEVGALFDDGIYEEVQEEIRAERAGMREMMRDPVWIESVFDGV